MKRSYWKFLTVLFFLVSCDTDQESKVDQFNTDTLSELHSVSSRMTFFDVDSIYNQFFQTESVFDGEMLKWETKFLENGQIQETLTDSINSMSYLVDALDLNSDGIGELVIVTGKTYPAFDNNWTMRCQIFCYVKVNNDWTKRIVPELTDNQLQGYFGNEVVSIKNNKIVRTFPIYNDNKEETGKNRVLTYGLDKSLELVVLKEITTANSTYPKGGVWSSRDSFAVNGSLVFQIKFCGKTPALRVAAKR